MKVTYLGPLRLGGGHAALADVPVSDLPASCYVVEVSEDAGVDGEIIEGDVLIVDEALPAQHGDLVLIGEDCELYLYRSHRIGGGMRMLPMGGGEGCFARRVDCRGVVVRWARQELAEF
ncbi:hypothetical protein [Modicisalibacter sp. MOD 31.J]|uniref:hypothetical protein n=1 Tax=Modicisalibacter sp. MOD 31.J TaxID=2831897 RepID=UPI001CCD8495|nr:hypothetical protein [Modicisalibacter sp. MOD 31.J]MBZ9576745.1 hypothetical protein [Modicisalibacter sp. MOD 31.J]